jgi:hypothetical protein
MNMPGMLLLIYSFSTQICRKYFSSSVNYGFAENQLTSLLHAYGQQPVGGPAMARRRQIAQHLGVLQMMSSM